MKHHSNNVVNGTTPKPTINEKPTEIQIHPQPTQPTDRNLVHVTKAQMKGDMLFKKKNQKNNTITILYNIMKIMLRKIVHKNKCFYLLIL